MDPTIAQGLLAGGMGVISLILGGIYKGQASHLAIIEKLISKTEPNGNHKLTHEKLESISDRVANNGGTLSQMNDRMGEVRDEIKDLNSNLRNRPCIVD